MIAKSLDAVRPFTSTTRATRMPAGPTIDRPGSTTIGSRVARSSSTSAAAYRSAEGTGPPSYEMPRPPPASRYSSASPASCACRARPASLEAALRTGSIEVICEPT